MSDKEIEIKIKLEEQQYKDMINLLSATVSDYKKTHQIDIYYSPQYTSYYDKGDRCLRLRKEDDHTILSYKRIYNEGLQNQYIEEYETMVEDADMITRILEAIGFKKDIVVNKERIEYLYDEHFIVLDKVEQLGYFVEIENVSTQKSIKERNHSLFEKVDEFKLDVRKRNREGYSNMLYQKIGGRKC